MITTLENRDTNRETKDGNFLSFNLLPFTHVYHKSRSHDVWFLSYNVQGTEFFCQCGPFFAL